MIQILRKYLNSGKISVLMKKFGITLKEKDGQYVTK
jgi:hypothetical protein